MKKVCIMLMSLASALGAAAQDVHEQQASISGRILDISGNPYPAQVRVFQIAIREGFSELHLTCVTNTGQEGGFECPNLSGGRFIVQILSLRRWGKLIKKAHDAAAGTIPESIFYPGVTDLEQATPISLRNNEAGWAEVRFADSPAVEVTGTLTDHAPSASLMLKAESGGLTLPTGINPRYDSSTGRFVISNVPAGHYQLTANWLVSQEERHTTLPLVVDATPVDHLALSAIPDVEVRGQLPTLPSGVTIATVALKCGRFDPRSQYISDRGSVQFWFGTCGRVYLESSARPTGLRGCGFCWRKKRQLEIYDCTRARRGQFRTGSEGAEPTDSWFREGVGGICCKRGGDCAI